MVCKKNSDIIYLVEVLMGEYKMSQAEIARYIGVERYNVCNWAKGTQIISPHNYEKVLDMILRLSGHEVKYKGQAIDILMGEE